MPSTLRGLHSMRSLLNVCNVRRVTPGIYRILFRSSSGTVSKLQAPPGQAITRDPFARSPRFSFHRLQSTQSSCRPSSFLTSTLTTRSMASLTPYQAAPSWTHSASDVLVLTKEAIRRDWELLNKVASLAPADCNFASVRDTVALGCMNYCSFSMAHAAGFREFCAILSCTLEIYVNRG